MKKGLVMKKNTIYYFKWTVLSAILLFFNSCTKDPSFEQGLYWTENHAMTLSKVDNVNGIPIHWNEDLELTPELKDVVKEIVSNMMKVDGGSFWMGAQGTNPYAAQYDAEALGEDGPVHEVTLDDFYIGKFEITQRQWSVLMGYELNWQDIYGRGDQIPAYNVTWSEAKSFVEALSTIIVNLNFTLPTEAQWEYAARGGNNNQTFRYSGSDDVNAVAWHKENCGNILHNVGEKQPNALGLFDMSGSLWEWCLDTYYVYPSDPVVNPCPQWGGPYVIRGGSWTYFPSSCRVTLRAKYPDANRSVAVGFRVVMNVL